MSLQKIRHQLINWEKASFLPYIQPGLLANTVIIIKFKMYVRSTDLAFPNPKQVASDLPLPKKHQLLIDSA